MPVTTNLKEMLRYENEIRERSIRNCGIFSDTYNEIFRKVENSAWQFPFTNEELEQMRFKIFTYNGAWGEIPSALFSKDVIKLAVDNSLIELRVVTRSGTYSLRPSSQNWPHYERIYETVKRIQDSDPMEFEIEYRQAAIDEGFDYQSSYSWYKHRYIWRNVARLLGLVYHEYQ